MNRVLNSSKKKLYFPLYCILSFIIIVNIFIIPVDSEGETSVSVDPSIQTVSPGGSFSISVYCVPAQPIKSFQLKISFNPSLLQAIFVTEGDIFQGYTTFFNPGSINNSGGTIDDIYDLIVGTGVVSSSRTFIVVSFRARSTVGTSAINLLDVAVTNSSEYVPIVASDGHVTIQETNQPPVYSSSSPVNRSTNVPITSTSLSLIIRDPDGDHFNYTIQTHPTIGSTSINNAANGTKTCTITNLAYSTTYRWYVNATDGKTWTQQWYSFTTKSESSAVPSNGGGGNELPSTPLTQNNSPHAPLTPIGPTFIERGVNYTYTGSALDPDGDQVRLRFDWGDGNLSNWSLFTDSNTTVSSSHAWNYPSNYSIRVIAQDKKGLNSSWSPPLIVTVSEQETSNEAPILEIRATNNTSINQTIVFDASGSIDPDGVIISNVWDFGDGTTGTGKTLNHTYTQPGIYQVTLTVTDNTGQTFTKIIQVSIDANAEASIYTPLSSFLSLTIAFICIVCAVSIIMVFFFRKNIRYVLLSRLTVYHKQKIEQLNVKKAQLTQNLFTKPNDIKNMNRAQIYVDSYDPFFEEKVDITRTLSIEEKIDAM